jgi:hypothetical protein
VRKTLPALNRSVKVCIAASLISLIVYTAYILNGSFTILFGYFANLPQDVSYVRMTGLVYWLGVAGLIGRFVAVILGLTALYLLWVKGKPFLRIKHLVAAAVFLEGAYFFSLTPSVWFLLRPSFITSVSLGVGYVLQILFTVPFLWILAFKVETFRESSQRRSILKFGAAAFLGYVAALAANEVSRWTSMISADTLRFLLQGIRAVGFLNAVVLMPLAVVFASVGAFRLIQQKERSAMGWLGASLAMVGLNYTIYVFYSYLTNSINTLPLVDVWTIPLFGLGIVLIFNSRKKQP